MIKSFFSRLALASLMMCALQLHAQLYEVPMEQKVAEAQYIVEGKVVAQRSFWNPQHTMIFTENTIEVSKSFKGEWQKETIQVVTQGGTVGNDNVSVDHLAHLELNDKGMFFLHPNRMGLTSQASGTLLYDIVAAEQGTIKYSIGTDKAMCPFAEYDGITTSLYSAVLAVTGTEPIVVSDAVDVTAERLVIQKNKNLAPGTITSFSPATVRAGALTDEAKNVLTINGSGFGAGVADGGSVVFRDGNTSTNTPTFAVAASSDLIISWTDNQIKLRVPSRASTGSFAVVNFPGDTALAPTPLQVEFAVLTASFSAPYGTKESRMVSKNYAGGYYVQYSISLAGRGGNIVDSAVYAPIRRAFETWRKVAGANIVESGNTYTQSVSASDGESVVMLDNDNTGVAPLASGVLAVTYSRNSICTNDPVNNVAQKTEFDIVIRNEGVSIGSTLFENGPCSPAFVNPGKIDMETVILHEIGHALNLAHINDPLQVPASPNNFANYVNPAGLMHYAVSNWQVRRSPELAALEGARYAINPRGLSLGTCNISGGEMTPLATVVPANDNCPTVFPTSNTAPGTVLDVDLRYATANKSVDPIFTGITPGPSPGQPGIAVTNNVYYAIQTGGSGELTFSVSGYSTLPVEVATNCAGNQGATFAIFDVNTCPAGQNFPLPVYNTRITGDGVLTAVSGLGANKTYLLYFDGFRNTKARFNMTLGGISLPIVLQSFSGSVLANGHHLLTAQIAASGNADRITIERSSNALDFTAIGQLNKLDNGFAGTRNFTNEKPLAGLNYYRLRIVDKDGAVRFSNIVALNSIVAEAISVLPNPFANTLFVDGVKSEKAAMLRITDVAGRTVFTKRLAAGSLGGRQVIGVPNVPVGTYLVQIVDAAQQVLFTTKLSRL